MNVGSRSPLECGRRDSPIWCRSLLLVHDACKGVEDNEELKRRKHTPEQIVRKLREADRLLAEGSSVAVVIRHLEVTEATYCRWRNQFGSMNADEAHV